MAAMIANKISAPSKMRIEGSRKMNRAMNAIEVMAEIRLGMIFLLTMRGIGVIKNAPCFGYIVTKISQGGSIKKVSATFKDTTLASPLLP